MTQSWNVNASWFHLLLIIFFLSNCHWTLSVLVVESKFWKSASQLTSNKRSYLYFCLQHLTSRVEVSYISTLLFKICQVRPLVQLSCDHDTWYLPQFDWYTTPRWQLLLMPWVGYLTWFDWICSPSLSECWLGYVSCKGLFITSGC